MNRENRNTLRKNERLHGRNAIDELFKKTGSHSMVAFPLRVVYALTPKESDREATVKMLVSVPKKHFKRAVKRNRVKRQVREAYRINKNSLTEVVGAYPKRALSMAFIWLDDSLHSSQEVEKKVVKLLMRIAEKISRDDEKQVTDTKTGDDE